MVNAVRRAARLLITTLTINTMSLYTMKVAHVAKMKMPAVVSDSMVTSMAHIALHKMNPTAMLGRISCETALQACHSAGA